jgi:hypothetical protein
VSVDGFQERLIWLQLAAHAVSPVGVDGGIVSPGSVVVLDVVVGFVVDVVVVVVVVVVGQAVATTTRIAASHRSAAYLHLISAVPRRRAPARAVTHAEGHAGARASAR